MRWNCTKLWHGESCAQSKIELYLVHPCLLTDIALNQTTKLFYSCGGTSRVIDCYEVPKIYNALFVSFLHMGGFNSCLKNTSLETFLFC